MKEHKMKESREADREIRVQKKKHNGKYKCKISINI